eukprot:g30257.t1
MDDDLLAALGVSSPQRSDDYDELDQENRAPIQKIDGHMTPLSHITKQGFEEDSPDTYSSPLLVSALTRAGASHAVAIALPGRADSQPSAQPPRRTAVHVAAAPNPRQQRTALGQARPQQQQPAARAAPKPSKAKGGKPKKGKKKGAKKKSDNGLVGSDRLAQQQAAFVPWLNHILCEQDAFVAPKDWATVMSRARNFYRSEELQAMLAHIDQKIEQELITARPHLLLAQDVKVQESTLALIEAYHPAWVQVAVSLLLARMVQQQPKLAKSGVSMDQLLEGQVPAATMSLLLRQYCFGRDLASGGRDDQNNNQKIIKLVLHLVYFCDWAKQQELLSANLPLFSRGQAARAQATVKANHGADSEHSEYFDRAIESSEDIVRFFAAYALSEGDVVRQLSTIGKLQVKENIWSGFDFRVSNIAADLRDGIRLGRLFDLLVQKHDLSRAKQKKKGGQSKAGGSLLSQLRNPAESEIERTANLRIVLDTLVQHSPVLASRLRDVSPQDIVMGSQKQTIELLSDVAFHLDVMPLIQVHKLETEIGRLKQEFGAALARAKFVESPSQQGLLYASSNKLQKLLHWVRQVCFIQAQILQPAVFVENFTSSFSDGRIFCLLISHYQPDLLSAHDIKLVLSEEEDMPGWVGAQFVTKGNHWVMSGNLTGPVPKSQRELSVRHNFQLLLKASQELGALPFTMAQLVDAEAVRDEKVAVAFTVYLFERLLSLPLLSQSMHPLLCGAHLRSPAPAAVPEQSAEEDEERRLEEEQEALAARRHAAAIKLQAMVRGWLARLLYQDMKLEKEEQAIMQQEAAERERMVAAEEARRRQEEQDRLARQQQERLRRAEEERRLRDEEQRAREEEELLREEEERILRAEAQRMKEEEEQRQRQQQERLRLMEEERRRKDEEDKRQREEEARLQKEAEERHRTEERRRAEEQRRQQEAEQRAREKALQEEQRRQQEQALQRAAQEKARQLALHQMRHAAATLLQARVRGWLARLLYRDMLYEVETSKMELALQCQRLARGFLARRRYQRMKQEHYRRLYEQREQAAATLQVVFRACLAQQRLRAELRAKQEAQQALELRREQAAILCQKMVRGWLARLLYQDLLQDMSWAAFTLQSHWRGKTARRWAALLQQERDERLRMEEEERRRKEEQESKRKEEQERLGQEKERIRLEEERRQREEERRRQEEIRQREEQEKRRQEEERRQREERRRQEEERRQREEEERRRQEEEQRLREEEEKMIAEENERLRKEEEERQRQEEERLREEEERRQEAERRRQAAERERRRVELERAKGEEAGLLQEEEEHRAILAAEARRRQAAAEQRAKAELLRREEEEESWLQHAQQRAREAEQERQQQLQAAGQAAEEEQRRQREEEELLARAESEYAEKKRQEELARAEAIRQEEARQRYAAAAALRAQKEELRRVKEAEEQQRQAAQQAQQQQQAAATTIQACYRAFRERRQLREQSSAQEHTQLQAIKTRLAHCNRQYKLSESIGARTESALEQLLGSRQLSTVITAIQRLNELTLILPSCCIAASEQNAVSALYAVLRSCNRSKPHLELASLCLSALYNIALYPPTREAVFAPQQCLDTLTDKMQMCRDKPEILMQILELLEMAISLDDGEECFKERPRILKRLHGIRSLTEHRLRLETRRKVAVPRGQPLSAAEARALLRAKANLCPSEWWNLAHLKKTQLKLEALSASRKETTSALKRVQAAQSSLNLLGKCLDKLDALLMCIESEPWQCCRDLRLLPSQPLVYERFLHCSADMILVLQTALSIEYQYFAA